MLFACVLPHSYYLNTDLVRSLSGQATRAIIARKLKGLEDFITVSSVHWHLGEKGWRFPTTQEKNADGEDVIPDPVHEDFTHLRHIYFETEPKYEGRFTVPVLYDKKQQRIVNNESSEILRMLGTVVSITPYPGTHPSKHELTCSSQCGAAL